VRERREVLVLAVEVEELVGVDAVDAGGVRARSLAGGREVVGPAAVVPRPQRVDVALPQRRERVEVIARASSGPNERSTFATSGT
jgi:hypothetical protein